MRHRVGKKHLNRDTDHRKALLRNLSKSLITFGSVETTLAKAKFVQPYVEKLVTKAKRGPDFTNINRVNAKLRSHEALKILFEDIAMRFSERNGGYTRVVKLGFRKGDRAPMARIEWVESPKKTKDKKATTKKASKKVNKKTKAKKSEKGKSQSKVSKAPKEKTSEKK